MQNTYHLDNTYLMAIFFRTTRVSWYQNVSTLDFIGAKGDGSSVNNWSY